MSQPQSPTNQPVQKTTMTLTMLHHASLQPVDMSMADIAHHLDLGEFVGGRSDVKTVDVADDQVAAELQAFGNDGTFFEQPHERMNDFIARVAE